MRLRAALLAGLAAAWLACRPAEPPASASIRGELPCRQEGRCSECSGQRAALADSPAQLEAQMARIARPERAAP
jgi:hypothetical protein